MKKNIQKKSYLRLAIKICVCISFLFALKTLRPKDNPFGDFDFNKFLQDLDSELSKIEKEEREKSGDPAGQSIPAPVRPGARPADRDYGLDYTATSTQAQTLKKEAAAPLVIPTDPEALFLNPPIIKSDDKSKKTQQQPVEQSYTAARGYLSRFTQGMDELDLLLDSMAISPDLNDHIDSYYQDAIIQAIVAIELLQSEQFYLDGLLMAAPGKKQNDQELLKMRQSIINTTKQLEKVLVEIRKIVRQEEEFDQSASELLDKASHDSQTDFSAMPSILEQRAKKTPVESTKKRTRFNQIKHPQKKLPFDSAMQLPTGIGKKIDITHMNPEEAIK